MITADRSYAEVDANGNANALIITNTPSLALALPPATKVLLPRLLSGQVALEEAAN